MKKILLLATSVLFVAFVFLNGKTSAQNCTNIDFSMGNFTNWQGRTGSCCPINLPTPGIVAGRHTIMGAGVDGATCGGLTLPAPGFGQVCRLGNNGTGAQAEGISYTYVVSPATALMVYTYAAVMEDPGHTPAEQPRFEIQVRDASNNIIPCTLYEISAGGGIPGFQNCGSVVWKDWTQVGVDLSGYIGQSVTIEMRTGDCSLSGHYGYGYIVAECQPLELIVEYCEGDTVASITAPDGFQSYLWSTGETTQTIAIQNPNPGISTVTCQITSVTGCTATLSTLINPVIVTANFTYNDNCGLVQFTDNSTVVGSNSPVVNQWNWDYDDAGATGNTNPSSHQYANSGTYDVTLIATSNIGCSDTITLAVPVTELPTAAFTVPTNCGLTNTFNATGSVGGSSAITDYDWNFGDTNTGTGDPVTHTYATSGNWNVQLVVTNADGCSDTLVQPFTNRVYPTADFDVQDVCEYDLANFVDQSVSGNATIVSWDWTFNPGLTSTVQNPSVQFPGNNTYNVELIIETNEGCADTVVLPVNIFDQPVANFTVSEVCLGEASAYTNNSSISSGTIATYTWDFGDPAFPDNGVQNPFISYTADGQYTSQLIVTSTDGCTDTSAFTFNVWPMPQVDFSVDSLVGCYPYTVDFTNLTTINSGNIANYNWNLDNGQTSTNVNDSYMYPNIFGQYTITLEAISDHGCDTSITRPNYITVYPKPTADFTVNAPCLGDGSVFQDQSTVSSGTLNYNWDFDHPNIPNSNLQNPVPAYPQDGQYNVQLIVTTNFGCLDTVIKPADIWPMPEIDFTAGPLVGCYPFTVDFDNLTTINSGTVTYTWNLGNGGGLIPGFETSMMYPNLEQNYTITLHAISDHGCDTSFTRPNYITVHPKPDASFTYTPTDLNVLDNVIHTENFTILGDHYFWDFGDGGTSTDFESYYQYLGDTGHYTITLVTTTNFGCLDTATAIVHIKPTFTIYIPNSFTPNADGLNDFFMVYGINLQNVVMRIFDRWGEELMSFSGQDPMTKGWDGSYKQQPAKQDVYVYRVEVTDINGDFHEFHGQVNLLR